jgi:transposase
MEVKPVIIRNTIINEAEVAEDLQVSKKQAKDWLRRLEIEGSLKKKRKLPGYIIASERQEKLIKNIEEE